MLCCQFLIPFVISVALFVLEERDVCPFAKDDMGLMIGLNTLGMTPGRTPALCDEGHRTFLRGNNHFGLFLDSPA